MILVSDREVDVFKRNLRVKLADADIIRTLYEVKLAAWRRIGDGGPGAFDPARGGFPVGGEPVLAWFPGGKGEPARVVLIDRFDGWVPPPLLWQPVVMPLLVSGAVRQPDFQSEIVVPKGS